MTVSVLATVAALVEGAKGEEVSLPAPRSMEATLETAAARVMVLVAGAAGEGLDVADGGRVVAGAGGEGQGVVACAEIDGAAGDGGAEKDGVGAGAADQGLNVGHGAGVATPAASVSLLAPVPRSTCMAVVRAVPRVTVSAPVPPVMVSVLATVAELVSVGEGQGVLAGAEIDGAVGDGAGQRDWRRPRCRR